MKNVIFGILLCSLPAWSQISFSNMVIGDLEHGSVRITASVSVNCYVQIKYGVSSGQYPYTSPSYLTGQRSDSGKVFLSLGALAPATTYYFVITGRPFANDATGQVNSAEFSFTTSADPGHPVLPIPPSVYNPTLDTSSGYTVVRMLAGATQCIAAANVGPISYGGGTWSVAANDSIDTVLSKVGYGAILEFDQSSLCKVPISNGRNDGVVLPIKAADPNASGVSDPAHRFILFRSKQVAPSDLPPDGYRADPSWVGKMAVFESQLPSTNFFFTGAQHFYADQSNPGLVHHYAFQNIELTIKASAGAGPWGSFFNFGSSSSGFSQANPPAYFIVDRVVMQGPTRPQVMENCMWGIGNHIVVRNSWCGPMDSTAALPIAFYWTDGGSGSITLDNNYWNANAQGIYFEYNTGTLGASHNDVNIRRNTLYWPASTLKGNAAWDGVERQFRNQLESKRGRRWLIEGNLIDGQWAYQNEGSAIFASGNNDVVSTGETGVTDWNIGFNLIRNSANLFDCMGTRIMDNPGPPDNSVNRRLLFHNNLAYKLGRNANSYAGHGGGLYSGYFINETGCQDLVLRQNTLGFTNADNNQSFWYIPHILYVGGGGPLSEGFRHEQNIEYFSVGNPTTNAGILFDDEQGCCLNFRSFPRPVGSSFNALLRTSTVQVAAAVTANGVWGNNVMIGGTVFTNNVEPWPDLTQAQLNAFAAGMPSGDLYVPGATKLAREIAAGVPGAASFDYTASATPQNPGVAGANLEGLKAAMGIVSHIGVRVSSTAARFEYMAPDARACSVDVSSNGGSSWTRGTDSSGSRVRALTIGGLAAGSAYQYRLLCVYDQTQVWFSFPSERTSMKTTGSFSTPAVATRTLTIRFNLPPGATSAQFTLTPLVGAVLSQTCGSSPCVIAGAPIGAILQEVAYLKSGGGLAGNGSAWLP